MKRITYLSFIFFFVSNLINAQNGVGINTTNPRTALDINGSVEISDELKLQKLDALRDGEPSTFALHDVNNKVKTLALGTPSGPAIGFFQEYVLTNTGLDFVQDFDTRIDATNYVVVIISSFYNLRLVLGGSDYSIPYASAFIRNGTWHLTANYPIARDEANNLIGEWNITTLIFTKNLTKQYSAMTIDMAGNSTGAAVTPLVD